MAIFTTHLSASLFTEMTGSIHTHGPTFSSGSITVSGSINSTGTLSGSYLSLGGRRWNTGTALVPAIELRVSEMDVTAGQPLGGITWYAEDGNGPGVGAVIAATSSATWSNHNQRGTDLKFYVESQQSSDDALVYPRMTISESLDKGPSGWPGGGVAVEKFNVYGTGSARSFVAGTPNNATISNYFKHTPLIAASDDGDVNILLDAGTGKVAGFMATDGSTATDRRQGLFYDRSANAENRWSLRSYDRPQENGAIVVAALDRSEGNGFAVRMGGGSLTGQTDLKSVLTVTASDGSRASMIVLRSHFAEPKTTGRQRENIPVLAWANQTTTNANNGFWTMAASTYEDVEYLRIASPSIGTSVYDGTNYHNMTFRAGGDDTRVGIGGKSLTWDHNTEFRALMPTGTLHIENQQGDNFDLAYQKQYSQLYIRNSQGGGNDFAGIFFDSTEGVDPLKSSGYLGYIQTGSATAFNAFFSLGVYDGSGNDESTRQRLMIDSSGSMYTFRGTNPVAGNGFPKNMNVWNPAANLLPTGSLNVISLSGSANTVMNNQPATINLVTWTGDNGGTKGNVSQGTNLGRLAWWSADADFSNDPGDDTLTTSAYIEAIASEHHTDTSKGPASLEFYSRVAGGASAVKALSLYGSNAYVSGKLNVSGSTTAAGNVAVTGNVEATGRVTAALGTSTKVSAALSTVDYWIKIAEADFPANTQAAAEAVILVTCAQRDNTNSSPQTIGVPKSAYLHIWAGSDMNTAPVFTVDFLDPNGFSAPHWDLNDFVLTYDGSSKTAHVWVQAPGYNADSTAHMYATLLSTSQNANSYNGGWQLMKDQAWAASHTGLGTDLNPTLTNRMYSKLSTDFVESNTTNLTLDANGDIILSADGDQITMDDGTTTRFTFNLDSTPELDIVGDFKLDGTGTVEIEAAGTIDLDGAGNITLDPSDALVKLACDGVSSISFDVGNQEHYFYAPGTTSDYFKIGVAADAVTTLSTTDSDGTLGDLKLVSDGDIHLDAAGGQVKVDGDLYVYDRTGGAAGDLVAAIYDSDDDGILKLYQNAVGKVQFSAVAGGNNYINNGGSLTIGASSDENDGSGLTVLGDSTGTAANDYTGVFRNTDTTDAASRRILGLRFTDTPANISSADYFIRCHTNGTSTLEWTLNGEGLAVQAFTGMHFVVFVAESSTVNAAGDMSFELEPGMIVETTGEIWNKRDVHTHLPKTRKCSTGNSKAVFGVMDSSYSEGFDMSYWNAYSGVFNTASRIIDDEIDDPSSYSDSSKNFKCRVNSVGDGAILVTNIGGNIENGDYITSSEVGGYGQLQSDGIMRNYTVAKCTETVDWDSVTDTIEHNGQTYKKCLVGCTYHCG